MVVHASGGEEIDQRRLGVTAIELGLEGTLFLDGAVDVGRHDVVDVGGEQPKCGQRPECRDQNEAARVSAMGHQNSSR